MVGVVFLVYYPCGLISSALSPAPPLFLFFPLLLLLLLASVLVEEKHGPVLVAHVGLVRQHELGQHVLVARDGDRILVFHDGAAVDVERGDEDILDMVLGGTSRVLRPQLAGRMRIRVVASRGPAREG